jgi:CRP-like cAMP-binding protein
MARNRESMQKLTELRERLAADINRHRQAIEALENQLKGVEQAIKAIGGEAHGSSRRTNVKRTVLGIIHDAGTLGVNAVEVVNSAAAKGISLDRASVSSLLSRLKREKTLTFNGERYVEAPPPEPEVRLIRLGGGK